MKNLHYDIFLPYNKMCRFLALLLFLLRNKNLYTNSEKKMKLIMGNYKTYFSYLL